MTGFVPVALLTIRTRTNEYRYSNNERRLVPFVEKLIDIASNPIREHLDLLLKDKSTKKNIIWATDTYSELGHGFTDKEQIDKTLLLQHADMIKPRIQKSEEAQQEAHGRRQRFLLRHGCAI